MLRTKFAFAKTQLQTRWFKAKSPAVPFCEMGNVELIELKKSSIQCPSCLHYVFEGTLLCKCGKLLQPHQDVMNWIEEAFAIPKAPHYRASLTARGSKCGPNPWQQHHHKARDALRSTTKGERKFTSIWDRWQNGEIYRKSQLSHNWWDAWVRYLDHIVHFAINHNAPRLQRERYVNLIRLRCVDENKQAGPLLRRITQVFWSSFQQEFFSMSSEFTFGDNSDKLSIFSNFYEFG